MRSYFHTGTCCSLLGVFSFLLLVTVGPKATEAAALFMTSGECAFCHTSSATALRGSAGEDLSIFHDWSSTMMANSFRDPVFRAKLVSEQLRNKSVSELISDKCLTCHTPMTRYQHAQDNGSHLSLRGASQNELSTDGVSCTLCHQILQDHLGTSDSFSGSFVINDKRRIYGPYRDVFANPMVNHVNYLPTYGEQIHESALCGSCHTLFTPYLNDKGELTGAFPEQTPFLEWLNSDYGSGVAHYSCQECHMERIEEPIKISNRPPWLKNRQTPFWKHHFTGGNSFVLEMLKAYPDETGLAADDEDMQLTIDRTKKRLQEAAVELSVDGSRAGDDLLQVVVTLKNKAGHKFPTGFPVRRGWLHFTVHDGSGRLIFESGAWDETGEIAGIDERFEPHYDLIKEENEVQIYEAVMKDRDQDPTFTLLEATGYLKDNRLVPEGFRDNGPFSQYTRIAGKVRSDVNFNHLEGESGSGSDQVHYEVRLKNSRGPFEVSASLLYQSIPPKFMIDLLQEKTVESIRLAAMYQTMSKEPVLIDSQHQVIP